VANAAHVEAVPGRNTDVCDSQWLADLLAHGLVRASFVPPPPIPQLRDLTRTRAQLVREKRRHLQRIHKTLERANIKLAAVLTDIMG
jgi:transposase